ncbi:hypothetical protein [Brevibacillus fortis]|uniref:hypothetical protein n=1 Tax=Brevibacillus fortis TaxID=2126352 RepID=UPI0038FC9EAD
MDKKQLLIDAISGNKSILAELNNFAENEGHTNAQVMLAVCSKIRQLEKETAELERALEQGNELKRERDIHEWFELTYSQYLTIPRSVLQSMPVTWQKKFVVLLDELDETQWLSLLPKDTCYRVELRQTKDSLDGRGWKWGSKVSDPLADYQRGRRNIFAE